MSYYVYITKTPQYFIAEVPALPGCRTLGGSEREAIENIRDVVRGYYQSMRKRNQAVPKVKVVKISNHAPASCRQSKNVGANPLTAETQDLARHSSASCNGSSAGTEVAHLGSASV